jgi:hypothetical protein
MFVSASRKIINTNNNYSVFAKFKKKTKIQTGIEAINEKSNKILQTNK